MKINFGKKNKRIVIDANNLLGEHYNVMLPQAIDISKIKSWNENMKRRNMELARNDQ